jgi:hypothetical protein
MYVQTKRGSVSFYDVEILLILEFLSYMTDKFFKQNFFNCDTLKYAKPRMKTLFIYFELKNKIHTQHIQLMITHCRRINEKRNWFMPCIVHHKYDLKNTKDQDNDGEPVSFVVKYYSK